MDVLAPAEEAAEAVGEPEIAPGTGVAADIELAPVDAAEAAEEAPEEALLAAEGVPIDEANFPDPVFREYVQGNFDLDGDGVLSQEERDAVDIIIFEPIGLTDLTGIEHFGNLTTLGADFNAIEALDVSQNTNLNYLWVSGNGMKALNLGEITGLIELRAWVNALPELDVNHCEALEILDINGNAFTELDVSACKSLRDLRCAGSHLSALDLSQNSKLQILWCSQNPGIETIDLSGNPELTVLQCFETGIAIYALEDLPPELYTIATIC